MSIKRYRKKPIEVEAVQWTGSNADEVSVFVGEDHNRLFGRVLYVATRNGKVAADIGDYIIKGIGGEFYPCKPDIFEQTYEVVECTTNK